MCELSHRERRPHRPAVTAVLAATLMVLGCAQETSRPVAVKEKPAEEMAAKPKSPAEAPSAPPPSAAIAPAAGPMPSDAPVFWRGIPELAAFHGYRDGIRWRLAAGGIELENATIDGHRVDVAVMQKVWAAYGPIIEKWSAHYKVPFEVIMTTVCVESRGNPRAKGGRNIGLMQILVPTARNALDDQGITEEALYDPDLNIQAGTAYIARQRRSTKYDPPLVAAAYNAGSLRSAENRWGLKQYGPHLDKTVLWFNAVLKFVAGKDEVPRMSFVRYFKNRP